MYRMWQSYHIAFQAYSGQTSLLQDLLLKAHAQSIRKKEFELQFWLETGMGTKRGRLERKKGARAHQRFRARVKTYFRHDEKTEFWKGK